MPPFLCYNMGDYQEGIMESGRSGSGLDLTLPRPPAEETTGRNFGPLRRSSKETIAAQFIFQAQYGYEPLRPSNHNGTLTPYPLAQTPIKTTLTRDKNRIET